MRKPLYYTTDETDTELKVQIELAGLTKKDIQLEYAEAHEFFQNLRNYNRLLLTVGKETYTIRFKDSLSLEYDGSVDNELDFSNTKATMEHGLLTVTIPKKQKEKKLITIT